MRAKDALGIEGEDAAARHLASSKKGLRILARRARVPAGEIDLVAMDGGEVVFVEVKTRRGAGFGAPEESVTWAKRQRLRRSATFWLDRAGLAHLPYRIDVIAVTVGAPGSAPHIEHFENAVGETG